MAPRLPIPGGDYFTWGTLLNSWLSYDHDSTGSHRPRVPDSSNPVNGSVNDGDVVYWDTATSSYKQALAGGTAQQSTPVGMKSHSDINPTIILNGVCDTTAVMSPGTVYYLSDTLAGRITSVPPIVSIKVGVALTTSKILIKTDTTNYGTFNRIKATLGSALVAGDFVLSAGWGTTASVGSINATDQRGQFTVSSAGTGQVTDSTITLTFHDGTWTTVPIVLVLMSGGTGNQTILQWNITATTLTITVPLTPVAGSTYNFSYLIIG